MDKIDIYDCGIIFLTLLSGRKIYVPNRVNYQEMIDYSKNMIGKINLGKKI